MGGGGGWDYDYAESALEKSSREYAEMAKQEGIVREFKGKGMPPPVGRDVSTESPTPLVVAVDVSGSMSHWPKLIFDKLPVLYNEAKLHLPDVEISFAAIGDNTCHMLQVCDFRAGKDLEEGINAIHPCGGDEYFEVTLDYYAHHCSMPKAKKGLFVVCGNEPFRDTIEPEHLEKFVGDKGRKKTKTADVIAELQKKFDLYMLYVPTIEGIGAWEKAFGKQMVFKMEDPRRIVDCIIGLCAIYADDYAAFEKRLSIRQTPEQVKQVLGTLHAAVKK
jgi:hypothetical protein